MMTADIKKKKKYDGPVAEMAEKSALIRESADQGVLSDLDIARTKKMGAQEVPSIKSAAPQSGMIKAILDKELGKKDVNAVTEVEGEVIEWKAGQNPRKEEIEIKKKYQDKLKKLRGK